MAIGKQGIVVQPCYNYKLNVKTKHRGHGNSNISVTCFRTGKK